MDQVKIGSFLKRLRKEKNLTQEELAEKLSVSGRTVSRWETGSNMPDIGMLVEIAEFYDVGIPEIINGERKSETMDQETKETAVKMAEYSKETAKTGRLKLIGVLFAFFGLFVIISALTVFPSESSWGSVYAVLGSAVLLAGAYLLIRTAVRKRLHRVLILAGCAVLLFAVFHLADYVAVAGFRQVPRFRYEVGYSSEYPDRLVYKTLFFTAVRENPGKEDERIEIVK